MDFVDFTAWVILGSAVSIVSALTIIVAAVQVPAMRRSLQAMTYRGALDGMRPFWELLAQYPQLHAVLYGGSDLETLSEPDRVRALMAWNLRMDCYQAVAVQSAVYDVFTQTMGDSWSLQLRDDLRAPAVQQFWQEFGPRFHPALRSWVALELSAIRRGD